MNLTLPSNSSEKYYPDNTLASYRTHLVTPIQVETPYEVALVEITVPTEWSCLMPDDHIVLIALRSVYALAEATLQEEVRIKVEDVAWENVNIESFKYKPYEYDDGYKRGFNVSTIKPGDSLHRDEAGMAEVLENLKSHDNNQHHLDTIIKLQSMVQTCEVHGLYYAANQKMMTGTNYQLEYPGLYRKNQPFIEYLNTLMSENRTNIQGGNILSEAYRSDHSRHQIFKLVEGSGHVIIKPPRHCAMRISKNLAHILGFEEQTAFFQETKSPVTMDIFGDVHNIYVYSDIIETRAVADKMAQLLRTVAVDRTKTSGSVQTISLRNLQFFPMRAAAVDNIMLYLRDRVGRPIPFLRGEVTVSLLVRPVE